jgi:hypothetical protein
LLACSKCKQEKPETDFSPNNFVKRGYSYKCKECCKLYARELRTEGRVQEGERRWQLRTRYGITLEEWEKMYDEQLGRCAICLIPLAECKIIATDHDHATGVVRGLLCNPCNLALGSLKDDPEIIRRMLHYVEQVRDPKSLTVESGGEM